MTVFAHAWFYVAFINRRDEHHARVMEFAQAFHGKVVATPWRLTAVADARAASHSRSRVSKTFRLLAQDASTQIIKVSPEHFQRGLLLYEQRPDKAWSLTDCTSFVVMEQEGLREALTGDRHFAQAGFVAIFAD